MRRRARDGGRRVEMCETPVTHHSIVSELRLSGSWWKLAESSTLELTSANTSLSTALPSNDHIWCRISTLNYTFFLHTWEFAALSRVARTTVDEGKLKLSPRLLRCFAFLFLKNKNIYSHLTGSWVVRKFLDDFFCFFHWWSILGDHNSLFWWLFHWSTVCHTFMDPVQFHTFHSAPRRPAQRHMNTRTIAQGHKNDIRTFPPRWGKFSATKSLSALDRVRVAQISTTDETGQVNRSSHSNFNDNFPRSSHWNPRRGRRWTFSKMKANENAADSIRA